MDEMMKEQLAYLFARQMLYQRETIDGVTTLYSMDLLTTAELCEVGRAALALIEEGKVT